MHIGFDVSQTGSGKAGCGFFAHALAEAMIESGPGHRYSLYPSFGDFYFDPAMPLTNPYPGRDVRYGPRHLTRESAAGFWNAAGAEAALGEPDIVHANNFWCPTGFARARVVYTCYDLGFTVDPSWTTEANRVGCFEGVFRAAVAADWIVAISPATREHFLRIFPHFPGERVRVVSPCSRFRDAGIPGRMPKAVAACEPGRFWLTVGTVEPRKNQERLVEAYARYLALGGEAMPLVVAGGKGWLMEGFAERLSRRGLAGRVILTGYVSDDELVWLYRHCFANLYPSLFEGFGLPVLEGMQFGAATIASSSSAIPEVAGEAGVAVDPLDTEGWAQAMLALARDAERLARLRAAAPAQAARFDRTNSARDLLALYEEAGRAGKRAAPESAHP